MMNVNYYEKYFLILYQYNKMQNSRLASIGLKSIKKRQQYTLLQEINPQQFAEDQPIRNASTLYLDQNGKQTQLSAYNSPMQTSIIKQVQDQLEETEKNDKDMYALPVLHEGSRKQIKKYGKFQNQGKMISSQYVNDKPNKKQYVDSVKEAYMGQRATKSLLSISRPKGFARKPKIQQIDFIGGNLYEVEDILSDIGKIMQRQTHKNIVTNSKQVKMPSKTNKWLNTNAGLSKLEQMLQSYKSTPDPQPVLSNYPRTQQPQSSQKLLKRKPSSPSEFPTLASPRQQKLSLITIKWNQMPMICCKWSPQIFLKLQSYPQQEQYRKIVLKAYSQQIKSYSIFFNSQAGIKPGKIKNQQELMSEEEYALKWQKQLPECSLTEQQTELLMQFDIEWYRTLIELCYHSGLEDLLQKGYNISIYRDMMRQIQRMDGISSEIVIKNQMEYLLEYFQKIYAKTQFQTILGLIRVKNDEKMPIEQIQTTFSQIIGKKVNKFVVWSLNSDQSQLIIALFLLKNQKNIQLSENGANIKMNNPTAKQPYSYTVNIVADFLGKQHEQQISDSNTVTIRREEDNEWELYYKLEKDQLGGLTYQVKIVEELLFGVVQNVQLNPV